MLERLKSIGAAAKDLMLFIIAPLLALAAGAYYLIARNKGLKTDVAVLESEKKSDEARRNADEKAKTAEERLNDYRDALNAYLKGGNEKP